MSNVIQFPATADSDTRCFETALHCHDIETIVMLALTCAVAEVGERAERWLAEVLSVRITA